MTHSLVACPAGAYGWKPLVLTAVLFFIIGFVTWLNGPLITFVRVAFSLDDVSSFLVPLVFYIAYFLFAIPASLAVARTGLRRGLGCALLIMAAGMAVAGQAMRAGHYPTTLAGFLVLGAGLAMLQVSVNPYVSFLGPRARGAQRIAIMGVCNKLGGILAPLVLASLAMRHIAGFASELAAQSDPQARATLRQHVLAAIYWPYIGMAALLAVTACWVVRSGLPDIDPGGATPTPENPHATALEPAHTTPPSDTAPGIQPRPSPAPDAPAPYAPAAPQPSRPRLAWQQVLSIRAVLGALAMFLYVGTEVLAGDAIGTYAQGFGISLDQTRFFTSLTLSCMLLGYLAGLALSPRFITQERYLLLSCALGGVFSLMAFCTQGYASILAVSLLGFANSMIFPSLFPIVLGGAEQAAAAVSAMLVMAYCGGGIVPQVFVALEPVLGFQSAFVAITFLSYGLIAAYGVLFSKYHD
ncbi:MFS transporter [Acetobacter sp. TBRC 12305]|uniref:MFS transporter n=1 Tax=Acetobacter garciniae TaxID=2817435 RepID=A0A939HMU5_9PROT|nr:MFS transporter [Acetobacter garciniae]MBO1324543.1 MFS transporter [Acetobacter garciniae]MBX0344232.1 MFS transporter [Acetobacter garciniae]